MSRWAASVLVALSLTFGGSRSSSAAPRGRAGRFAAGARGRRVAQHRRSEIRARTSRLRGSAERSEGAAGDLPRGPRGASPSLSSNGPAPIRKSSHRLDLGQERRGHQGFHEPPARAATFLRGPHRDRGRHRFRPRAIRAESPYVSDRHVIDVSGDGTNNSGRDVRSARDEAVSNEVTTINGLVIFSDAPIPYNPEHTNPPGGLDNYYRENVIGGTNAFVMAAENFESFGRSIVAKLIREISAAPPPARHSHG